MQAIPVPFGCDETCEGVSRIVTTPGPSGGAGSAGADGTDGVNAFSLLTAGFTMPAVNANVSATVEDNTWAALNQILFVENAGYMQLVGKTLTTGMTLKNLGYTANAAPGAAVANGGRVSPGGYTGTDGTNGTNGTNGVNSYTVTTADFTMPAISGSVAGVLLANGAWIGVGQMVYVATAGYMQVTAKASSTSVTLLNTGADGNAAGGTIIASGSTVSPSGPQAGTTGPAGGDLKGTYPSPLLSVANTKGSLPVGNGTDTTALPVGADATVLIADSTQGNGARWGQVGTANIADGAVTSSKFATGVFPAGMIMPWPGNRVPGGWLLCDGSAVAIATYPILRDRLAVLGADPTGVRLIGVNTITGLEDTTEMKAGMAITGVGIPFGTTIDSITGPTSLTMSQNASSSGTNTVYVQPWGAGDGATVYPATTFNVPDLRGRTIIGFGTGTGLTARSTMGEKMGTETHLLTAAESGLPAHTHTGTSPKGDITGSLAIAAEGDNFSGTIPLTVDANAAANAAAAHQNMQPSVVLKYIIKT